MAFCWKRAQWWQQHAKDQADDTGYLAEGRIAYAIEQSKSEERRALQWASMWKDIRARAGDVVKCLLSGEGVSDSCLPELVVEIEPAEDERDDEGDMEDVE